MRKAPKEKDLLAAKKNLDVGVGEKNIKEIEVGNGLRAYYVIDLLDVVENRMAHVEVLEVEDGKPVILVSVKTNKFRVLYSSGDLAPGSDVCNFV